MRETILKILADTLGFSSGLADPSITMEALPAWDSVAHLNLVLSLEQHFGVQFDPEVMMKMVSIPAIEAALAEKGVR